MRDPRRALNAPACRSRRSAQQFDDQRRQKHMEMWSHPPERCGNSAGSHRNRCCRRSLRRHTSGSGASGGFPALTALRPFRHQHEKARRHVKAGFFVRPWNCGRAAGLSKIPVAGGRSRPGKAGIPAPRAMAGRWYHGLPLEHGHRIIIFHYKIAPVCGILSGNTKTTSPTS
jgi:hypothetical protein